MEFDLWKMLGVSPLVGMGGAAAALVFAVLYAVWIAVRNRGGASEGGFSLRNGD